MALLRSLLHHVLFLFCAAIPFGVTSNKNDDFDLILQRRLSAIVDSVDTSSVANWYVFRLVRLSSQIDLVRLSTLERDGKWSGIDYATGCSARRANWPAQDHWTRIGGWYYLYILLRLIGITFYAQWRWLLPLGNLRKTAHYCKASLWL
jgi:hypothetical protein